MTAATRPTSKLPRRSDAASVLARARDEHQLEQLLIERYTAWKGHAPYSHQLPNLVATGQWLRACLRQQDGDELHRSIPQIARGIGRRLGWKTDGCTVRQLKDRYGQVIRRTLRYFEGMGLIDSWEAVYDERHESSGLSIRVAADARLHLAVSSPCSSTGAATAPRRRPAPPPRSEPRHPKPGPRRAFSEPTVSPPSGETDHDGAPVVLPVNSSALPAGPARHAFPAEHDGENGSGVLVGTVGVEPVASSAPASTAAGEDGTAADGALIEALRRRALAAVRDRAWDLEAAVDALLDASAEGAPSMPVVIAGWAVLRQLTGRSADVRLRPQRYRDGLAALDLADRYGNFGDGRTPRGPERGEPTAGAGLVLHWLLSSAAFDWQPLPISSRHRDREPNLNAAAAGEVGSLAHFLCQIGQAGRQWRRHHRARAGYNGARKGRRRGTARARRRRAG